MRLIRVRNLNPRRAIILLTFLTGLSLTLYIYRVHVDIPEEYEGYYTQAIEQYNTAKEQVYKNFQYYAGTEEDSNNITGIDPEEESNEEEYVDTGVSTRVPEEDKKKFDDVRNRFEDKDIPEIEELPDDPSSDQNKEDVEKEQKLMVDNDKSNNSTTTDTSIDTTETNFEVEKPEDNKIDEIMDDHDTNNLIKSEKIKTENKIKEEEIDIENEKKKSDIDVLENSTSKDNSNVKETDENENSKPNFNDVEEPKNDKFDEILDDHDTNTLEKIEKINTENNEKINEIETEKDSLDNFLENSSYKKDESSDSGTSESDANEDKSNALFKRLQYPLFTDVVIDERASELKLQENIKIYKDALKKPISEPKLDNLVRQGDPLAGRANATILALVRNDDLDKMVSSIQQFEEKFNFKFGYPYTLMNDEPFTEEFQNKIKSILPSKRVINFVHVNPEEWNMPDTIDRKKYKENTEELAKQSIQHVEEESYHNMCRFYSRSFYHQDILKQYKYTWRIEPDVNFYCDIDYDIFQFMEMNDKIYGFTISLYDEPNTVKSLWNRTMEFVKENPQFLNENGSYEWLKENLQKPTNFEISGYSTCHFWTNFEITNLDFLRSDAYEKYVKFLETTGGFYYERWGDAPVRSIALGLFADKSKIHWFRDVAYQHFPYTNCPASEIDSTRCDGKCKTGRFSPYRKLNVENCLPTWIKYSMTEEQLNLY